MLCRQWSFVICAPFDVSVPLLYRRGFRRCKRKAVWSLMRDGGSLLGDWMGGSISGHPGACACRPASYAQTAPPRLCAELETRSGRFARRMRSCVVCVSVSSVLCALGARACMWYVFYHRRVRRRWFYRWREKRLPALTKQQVAFLGLSPDGTHVIGAQKRQERAGVLFGGLVELLLFLQVACFVFKS